MSQGAHRPGGLFSLVTVQAAAPEGVLGEVQGIVLVSQGRTYTAARSGMSLRLGARVLTLESGSAVVTPADGCVTRHPKLAVHPQLAERLAVRAIETTTGGKIRKHQAEEVTAKVSQDFEAFL